jgi:hydrogenase maturation protease
MASNKWREASVSPTSKGDGQGPRGDERHSLPATLVIGLGNSLRGDDGVGVRVAQILAAQALPDDVEVVDGGTQGLGIVNLMEGRQRVILVDAADVGIDSGEFVRFTLDEARLLGDDRHLSVHAAGLRDALLLAQALEVLPDEVVIFGVQPANLEWDSTLSPQVEAALPSLVAAVLAEVAVSDQWPMLGISPQADC